MLTLRRLKTFKLGLDQVSIVADLPLMLTLPILIPNLLSLKDILLPILLLLLHLFLCQFAKLGLPGIKHLLIEMDLLSEPIELVVELRMYFLARGHL